MVAHNFLSAPEQLARAITIIFGIVVIITCIIQNLFRKYDAFHLPLVKYTTLWDVKTLAPTIQFCLQDLNGKTLDVVLNVNTSLGGPRQNTSSLNKFVNNLSNKDQSCFVFDGDKYPEYYTEEAPIFGFFVSPIGNFSNDLDGVIRVTVFEDSNINDSEPMNRFTVPLGYQYHLQYTEIRNHNLIEPTFSRSFKFLPILNLGTKSPSVFA
ncbi:hypothetical protein G9A89_019870 [Geosiphon pyriformis]|nr:hypothetical protein G9A89_019870 [Geosiphon pyriformis]